MLLEKLVNSRCSGVVAVEPRGDGAVFFYHDGAGFREEEIPFTPMFRRVLPYVDFQKAKTVNVNTIQTTFKRLFSNHHPHELRYTFITRAKEAGCNLEAVMIWAGHSFDKDVKTSAVDRGYTDYSLEYILAEAEKVNYDL